MASTCFELEGSSSRRRLYIQVLYSTFFIHQYKQSSRQKNSLLPIRLLITIHVKRKGKGKVILLQARCGPEGV